MHFFITTNASSSDAFDQGSVVFSDAMFFSNRFKGEVTLFGFHRSDLMTVGNYGP